MCLSGAGCGVMAPCVRAACGHLCNGQVPAETVPVHRLPLVVQGLRVQLMQSLLDRWGPESATAHLGKLYRLATALDPFRRDCGLLSGHDKDRARKHLEDTAMALLRKREEGASRTEGEGQGSGGTRGSATQCKPPGKLSPALATALRFNMGQPATRRAAQHHVPPPQPGGEQAKEASRLTRVKEEIARYGCVEVPQCRS